MRLVRLFPLICGILVTLGVTVTVAAAPASAGMAPYTFETQKNSFYCGPAATRLALTSMGHFPTQAELAGPTKLMTDRYGQTLDIYLVTNVINSYGGSYGSVYIPSSYTNTDLIRFWSLVTGSIDRGHPVVANVWGSATDTGGVTHTYNQGHYLTIVGYPPKESTQFIIEDIAISGGGRHQYRMGLATIVRWIANNNKGYSAG